MDGLLLLKYILGADSLSGSSVLALVLGLSVLTTWRLALLYCAKHLLHFDEARQKAGERGWEGEGGGERERERVRERKREEETEHPLLGWMCF